MEHVDIIFNIIKLHSKYISQHIVLFLSCHIGLSFIVTKQPCTTPDMTAFSKNERLLI